jgi:hypothetical protein
MQLHIHLFLQIMNTLKRKETELSPNSQAKKQCRARNDDENRSLCSGPSSQSTDGEFANIDGTHDKNLTPITRNDAVSLFVYLYSSTHESIYKY